MKYSCEEKFYFNRGNLPLLNLVTLRPGRALDCGCGSGNNARILKERGWTVTGITISPDEQQAARAYCDQVYLFNLEAGLPEAVGTGYDLIVLSHVLEHLADPTALLQAVKKVLAPDGIVAVALPNALRLRERLKFTLGKFEYENNGIMDQTHLRFYTYSSAYKLLQLQGYNVLTNKAVGWFPLFQIRDRLPESFVTAVDELVCKLWPGLFGFQLLYLVKPLPQSNPS